MEFMVRMLSRPAVSAPPRIWGRSGGCGFQSISSSEEDGRLRVYASMMDRVKFENLVDQCIRELPAEFRKRLENVVVIVEDRPSEEVLDDMEITSGDTLFGLYEGTPLTERGFNTPLYPDRIWIFQGPIEEECESEEEIMEGIKTTIVHEVAHFFGLDDEYLKGLGY
jgi:predicted Zn-dependent protease with MMP-like domain